MFNSPLSLFLFILSLSSVYAQDTLRVLHYTETTGYDHNTRTESKLFFERICDSLTTTTPYTWILTHSDTSEVFNNLTTLQSYSVVIWSNTSGADGLTINQRLNYEQYVSGGGNYLGIHAAADTYRHSTSNGNNTGVWDFYGENLAGCSVQESPHHTSADHNNNMIHTASHPILNGVPNPWNKTEEYYYWENGFLNLTFTELLQVDATGPNSYDIARMTSHYKEHGWGSRSFYTSLGHDISNYTSDENFELLLKNALYWSASPSFPAEIHELIHPTLTVYPNPFLSSIKLETGVDEKCQLIIYDALSREVYSGEIEKETTLDLSHLKKGIYYVFINNQKSVYPTRIVKN